MINRQFYYESQNLKQKKTDFLEKLANLHMIYWFNEIGPSPILMDGVNN